MMCLKCPGRREKNIFLSDLRSADDVALTTEDGKGMEQYLNIVNKESLKIDLRIHKGKSN